MPDDAPSDPPSTRPKRGRRKLRALLVTILVLVMLVGGGYYYVTRPAFIIEQAEAVLEEITAGEVTISDASFAIKGPVELRDVTIRLPDFEGEPRLAHIERILIEYDPWSLLRLGFRVKRIHLFKTQLFITENVDRERFNFQVLQERLAARPPKPPADRPLDLPELFAPDATLVIGRVTNGRYEEKRRFDVKASVVRLPDKDRRYRFALQPERSDLAPRLIGEFNPDTGDSEAQLTELAVDSPLASVLPASIRKWWSEREPVGKIGPVVYAFEPGKGLRVEIPVTDVEITPPYVRKPVRLHSANGKFTIVNAELKADLTGTIAGMKLSFNGTIDDAFSDDPNVDLTIKIDGKLEPEPAFLAAMDPSLRATVTEELNAYRPDGPFDATIKLTRKPGDARLRHDVTINLKKVTAQYWRFTYPLHDITGRIHLTPERVDITDIKGIGPSGAVVTISGNVINPGPAAQTTIHVNSDGMPVDQHLLKAMSPDEANVVRLFVDEAHYQRLIERKLVRPTGMIPKLEKKLATVRKELEQGDLPEDAIAVNQALAQRIEQDIKALRDVPLFDLGGDVPLKVRVFRPGQVDGEFTTRVEIGMKNQNLVFHDWPYPMTTQGGRIIVEDGHVTVDHIRLRGVTGAEGEVDGEYKHTTLPDGSDHLMPSLALKVDKLPVDEYLLFTLPKQDASLVRSFEIDGRANATGRIFTEAQKPEVTYEINATLADAHATPNRSVGGRYQLEKLSTRLNIKPGRITFNDVKATHDKTTFQASGYAVRDEGSTNFMVQLNGKKLRFEDPVTDLIPRNEPILGRIRELEKTYQPRGVYDAELTYRVDESTDYALVVQPAEVSLMIGKQRVALSEIEGKVKAQPGTVQLETLKATFGEKGKLSLSGRMTTQKTPSIDLDLTASCDSLSTETMAVLPPVVKLITDTLELKGSYELREGKIRIRPGQGKDDPLDYAVTGTVQLRDASATIAGIPITQMEVEMGLVAAQQKEQSEPRIDLRFNAQQLRFQSRLIKPLRFRVASDREAKSTFNIEGVQGSMYGGSVTGDGRLKYGEKSVGYVIGLALQDIALHPLAKPQEESKWREQVAQANKQPAEDTKAVEAEDAKPKQDGGGQADSGTNEDGKEENGKEKNGNAEGEGGDEDTLPGLVSARIDLRGDTSDAKTRSGRGRVEVKQAHFYEFPLGMAIVQLFNLTTPRSSAFQQVIADFRIAGDTIRFNEVRLMAPSLEMRAKEGTMDWPTRKLDLLLYSRRPGDKSTGPLERIWGTIKGEIFAVRVEGTLEQPKARVVPLTRTVNTWQEIFGAGGSDGESKSP